MTMPVGQLTDEALAFVAYLGVEYVTTGGPASPTYTPEGRVVQARPSDPPPPWKDEDLRRMKDRSRAPVSSSATSCSTTSATRSSAARAPTRTSKQVQESIRVAGNVGIPIVEYNWYALRAMGGYYEEAGSRRRAPGRARLRSQP